MFGLEALIVPLSVEIGKKVINSLWPDEWTRTPAASRNQRRTPGAEYPIMDFVSSRNFSNSYPRNVLRLTQYFQSSWSVAFRHIRCFLLLVDERDGSAVFGEIDVNESCEIKLPDGVYSAYTFLLDRAAKHIEDSVIIGLGLPMESVGGVAKISYNTENVMDLLLEAPVHIYGGRKFGLELMVVKPQDYPSLPQYFDELFVDVPGKMTGTWSIDGNSSTSSSQSEAQLVQVGDEVHGLVVTHWVSSEGDEWVVQQFVGGALQGERLQLEAYEVRVLLGPEAAELTYELDSWEGVFEAPNRLRGYSWDAGGSQEVFMMERI